MTATRALWCITLIKTVKLSALHSLSVVVFHSFFYDVLPPSHSVCCPYNGSYVWELISKLLKEEPVFSVHSLWANGVQQRQKTEKESIWWFSSWPLVGYELRVARWCLKVCPRWQFKYKGWTEKWARYHYTCSGAIHTTWLLPAGGNDSQYLVSHMCVLYLCK